MFSPAPSGDNSFNTLLAFFHPTHLAALDVDFWTHPLLSHRSWHTASRIKVRPNDDNASIQFAFMEAKKRTL